MKILRCSSYPLFCSCRLGCLVEQPRDMCWAFGGHGVLQQCKAPQIMECDYWGGDC